MRKAYINYNNYGRKRKVNVKRLLLSLVFLCIITLMPMAYSSFFSIKQIKIIGNQNISSKAILTSIDYYYDKNLLTVNPKKVKQAIQQTLPIEEVNISYELPDTLIVKVKEREVSAALDYIGGFVLIDKQGYVVKLTSDLKEFSVPIITGFNVIDAKVASLPVIEEDMSCFAKLLDLLDSLQYKLQELSEINVMIDKNSDTFFSLYTLDGYKVFLGKWDDCKIEILDELLADLRRRGMGKGVVDISGETPAFRPFDMTEQAGEEKGNEQTL